MALDRTPDMEGLSPSDRAKIYKERSRRNFKNNAEYKEGRQVRSSRTARAMAKGSRFGQAAEEVFGRSHPQLWRRCAFAA